MLLGDRPIRDFSDPGWPLTYAVSALAWSVAGNAMATEWSVVAVGLGLAASFTLVAAYRLTGSLALASLATLAEVAIYPRTYAYPKMLVYAAGALAMLHLASRPSGNRLVGLAAIIATAFLFRHDHGLYLGIASVACVVVVEWPAGWKAAAQRAVVLTLLAGLFITPWALYVQLNGGLGNYFARAIEYAAAEANASVLKKWPAFVRVERQPILGLSQPERPLAQIEWTTAIDPATRASLERAYGLEFVRGNGNERFYHVNDTSDINLRRLAADARVVGSSGLGRVRRPAWREWLARLSPARLAPGLQAAENADAWLFWLFWILPAFCAACAVARAIRGTAHSRGETAFVIGLALLALAVNGGFLRDILRTRFADAVVPQALLGAWALGLCWTAPWRRRHVQRLVAFVSVVLIGVTAITVSFVGELPERLERSGLAAGITAAAARGGEVAEVLGGPHRQSAMPVSRYDEALMPFYAYVDRCVPRADRLIIIGEFPEVPVLAGRRFATDGVVLGAWYSSAVHQDETIARMQSHPPVLALQFDDDRTFRGRFPLIGAYLDAEFFAAGNIAVPGAGIVRLFANKRYSAAARDTATGWPCFD